ncbi:MAG: NAD(P)H-dependent oxidoreductase [Candidatus Omnitrophica bacterium]|nr:NAD(P)H-dependent oxidoreductase [Candidatus Omnitrophota bacterium]MCM8808824.1 NAD(P)H-dependent oxidoreductase [Candidatus Omnitrophota bacterium]MCM8811138.1 NAD(P)H-dependent oxidoreductase [Candidatus Omnitrophota bacterium]
MKKVLIIYHSKTGNTEEMAKSVAEGVKEENLEVILKSVEDTKVEDMLDADGIIVGSPTYFGLPSYEIKKLFDESVKYYGSLEGKVGGAFTSSALVGGGNETTIMGIIQIMLIHGMIIQGTTKSNHYGPVSIGKPDNKVKNECKELGKRVAKLIKKIKGE